MRERDVEALIREQIAYYRTFTAEYDRWFRKPTKDDQWNRRRRVELGQAVEQLLEAVSGRRVLEIACGTGWWTERLAQAAASVVALDAAPEAVEVARSRASAEFVVADVFSWRPEERYDVVFFAYWLSHVPPERFEAFWDLVDRALVPEGRVFFVDKPPLEERDEALRPQFRVRKNPDGTAIRRVEDGREFQMVDIYYDPRNLESRLLELAWDAEVVPRGSFFFVGTARRRRARRAAARAL